MKEKSPATKHIGIAFTIMGIFNIGYLVSSSVYHPAAAYHRWLTVLTILLAENHFNYFFFLFPDTKRPLVGRIFLYVSYAVTITATLVFCAATFNADTVFQFAGHYYDFDAEAISRVISLLIIFNILIGICLATWRTLTAKKGEKRVIGSFIFAYILATIVPALLNALSRDGAVSRELFQNSWVVFNVMGFFVIAMIFINNSRDRISFMGKLIGSSVVTLLVLLQFFSFFSLQNREEAFDDIYFNKASLAINTEKYRHTAEYIFTGDVQSGSFISLSGQRKIAYDTIKPEVVNTIIVENIKRAEPDRLIQDIEAAFPEEWNYSDGYRKAVMEFAGIPEDKKHSDPVERIVRYVYELNSSLLVDRNRIKQIPNHAFREELKIYMEEAGDHFVYFSEVIEGHLKIYPSEGAELKNEILRYIAPMNEEGSRVYRTAQDGTLYIAYIYTDYDEGVINEAAFKYTDFREYMHSAITVIVLLLVVFLFVIRFGFQFIFSGVIVQPLRDMSSGVKEVNRGNLDVVIPVRVSDEIGYVARSFNNMVGSIKNIIETVTNSSTEVKTISNDLADSSQQMSDVSRELSSIVEETAAAYEEMSSSFESNLGKIKSQIDNLDFVKNDITEINTNSDELNKKVSALTGSINDAVSRVEDGEETMKRTVGAIEEMSRYLKEIEGAVNSINEVADKINLLALNAAIEASRAGDAGKGFSVVADEVNKLADLTTELAKGIQSTITSHMGRMSDELEKIRSSSDMFSEVRNKILETKEALSGTIDFTNKLTSMNADIHEKIITLSGISNDVYGFSVEQKNIIDELTGAINNINTISQTALENADMVKSYSAIIDMSANDLIKNLESFRKLEDDDDDDDEEDSV